MKTIIWLLIIAGVGLIVSLFLEEGREWWEDAWEYLITFEWWEDIKEFFGGMFENLGEFSAGGLLFGIATLALVYLLRKKMLNPFLVHFTPATAIFWGGVTYLGCFVVGYLIGKRLFDNE